MRYTRGERGGIHWLARYGDDRADAAATASGLVERALAGFECLIPAMLLQEGELVRVVKPPVVEFGTEGEALTPMVRPGNLEKLFAVVKLADMVMCDDTGWRMWRRGWGIGWWEFLRRASRIGSRPGVAGNM